MFKFIMYCLLFNVLALAHIHSTNVVNSMVIVNHTRLSPQLTLNDAVEHDFELFKADKMHVTLNYNIGDLLNMPTYIKDFPWVKNHTSGRLISAKATAARVNNTILNYYFSLDKNVSLSARYPIIPNIIEAVRLYGSHALQEHNLPKHYEDVRKNTTLLVHIRSGDKGPVAEHHAALVAKLSLNFTKVVIMGGVHFDRGSGNINDTAHRTSLEIHKIANTINNEIGRRQQNTFRGFEHHNQSEFDKCVIHYGTNPDDDIYLMSVAANLMLHRGGYTAIGGLVCQGKVYFVRDLSCYYYNPEYMREIRHPVILTREGTKDIKETIKVSEYL